ncbi:MAG TPA: 30S ribosomal protein S7 [Candidatus Enterousia intestinigallinarum]|uniref:Small ribosomal subunit protein uS7 n=1 Tax=Candidatus Enterousia intestinigallinarum TaxID=2840790 RepID=A0A9D1FFF9_9PROT|nr:30S ribosomal protein S7 [Candidatus Enterousia intestinigallinarum]
MSRRKSATKREILPDSKYNNLVVAKCINVVMWDGKKEVAENIVYGALDKLKKIAKDGDELAAFLEAVDALKPSVEVKGRRVGGATYQVPVEVRPARQQTLALRWLIMFARKRGERSMEDRLFGELRDALNGQGGAFKKKIDTHKMAEANKAFAHFRW